MGEKIKIGFWGICVYLLVVFYVFMASGGLDKTPVDLNYFWNVFWGLTSGFGFFVVFAAVFLKFIKLLVVDKI